MTTDQRTRDDGIVPVTPLRRSGRGPDRAAVVGVLLVAFIGVAIAKPWESAADRSGRVVAPAVGPAAPEGTAASDDPGRARLDRVPLGLPTLRWDDLGELEPPVADWGVRAILARPDRLPGDRPRGVDETLVDGWFVSQRWSPGTPLSLGLPSAAFDFRLHPRPMGREGVIVQTDRHAVAALGVTTPPDAVPLDVRIWRLEGDTVPERLATREMLGREPGGQRLFLPPPAGPDRADHWSPGLYRIDLLLGDRISRLTVLLPGPPLERTDPQLPLVLDFADLGEQFPDFAAGPFVVDVAGTPHHLPAAASEPLDLRAAWLQAGRRPGPGESNVVPRVAADDAVAIGFKLAPRPAARIVSGELYRLAPEAGPDPVAPMVSSRSYWHPPPLRMRIAWAVSSRADRSLTWAPGIYRMDIEWADLDGHHRASWHLDLVPQDAPAVEPPFLAAVRDWAGYARRPGVVVGTARQHEGGPRSARIRYHPQQPGTVPAVPEDLGATCGDGALIDPGQRLIGVTHVGVGPPTVVVRRLFHGGQRLEQPVVTVASAIAGLVVIGSVDGRTWQPGVYQVALSEPLSWAIDGEASERPADKDRFVFCVGRHGSGGLQVPGSTISAEAYRAASLDRSTGLGGNGRVSGGYGGPVMLPR